MGDGGGAGARGLISFNFAGTRHPLEPDPKPMATDECVEVDGLVASNLEMGGLRVGEDRDGGEALVSMGPLDAVLKGKEDGVDFGRGDIDERAESNTARDLAATEDRGGIDMS